MKYGVFMAMFGALAALMLAWMLAVYNDCRKAGISSRVCVTALVLR